MPSARVSRRGATISARPSPMLNQPSPFAILSAAPAELVPVRRILGSPADRVTFERSIMGSPRSRLENNFDAAVLFVAEHLVHLGSLVEADGVRDDERRI